MNETLVGNTFWMRLLGSYLLEYSCAVLGWLAPSDHCSNFYTWQGERRGTWGTIERPRHQSLSVSKPQGHRIAQKALPAVPVSILQSMESPDIGTFLLRACAYG